MFTPTQEFLNDQRDRMENLCRVVAPIDLAGVPFYLNWQSEIPGTAGGRGILGITSRRLDLFLKPYTRQWCGRGVGIVLNDELILEGTAPGPAHLHNVRFEQIALGVALHELGHDMADGFALGGEDAPAVSKSSDAAIKNYIVTPQPCQIAQDLGPWVDHDDRWIRACLHLHRRAVAADEWLLLLELPRIANTEFYGLSDVYKYDKALGDEPERMAGASFIEILDTAPPPAFRELWQRDVKTIKSRNQPATVGALDGDGGGVELSNPAPILFYGTK